jgi:hypothetical protein
MKTKSVLRTRRAGARKGFALITTVTILVLLSLIAIGLLSLSAVTVRSSSAELAKLEARANARLALMLAIGDLQKQLGPDQRVSAAAGILDESPESLSIEGVDQPFWTGVWSTEWLGDTGSAENKSPWVRNDLEGGLSDRRFEEGYDREKEVLNYLVSGNEGGRLERGDDMISAQNARLEENAILLVGPGTVEDGAGGGDSQEVLAPRVATWKNGRETGGYAFWVGDLGVKAHVAQVDEYSLDNPRRGNSPDGMERLVNAQDTAEEKIAGLGELDDDEARRTVSHKTLGLAQNIDKDDMKVAYHHITTNSKAVLANVRQGGLQRDLTAFLHSRGRISDLRANGRIVSQGLNDLDNMIGPANPNVADEQGTRWAQTKYRDIAPTFALLRNWSLMGSRFGYSESEHNMIAPAPAQQSALRGMNDGVNVYDGGNLRPASFLPFDKPNMFPVMVEGSIYYNLASYPDTPGAPNTQYNLRICYYPRIALWNPFNVELQTGPMVATIFVNGNKDVQVTGADGTRRNVPIPFGRGSTKVGAKPSAPDQSPGHYVGWILMNIAPTTMLPGETLVFSPERTQQYEISNVFRNTLSSSVAPDPAIYFWQDMQVKHTSPLASFVEFPGPGNQSGGDNYMMSLKDATSVRGRATDSSFNNLQSIVYANTSVQAGGSDELPVQWSARNPVPVYPLRSSRDRLPGTAIPDTRTRDGFRFRWWQEHASNIRGSGQLRRTPHHLQTSIVGTWNPRAAYFCRTPWDNVTDLPPHFYGVYTRDLFDSAVSWQAMMPRPKDGRMLGNPFGAPVAGPDEVVLFEVPRQEIGIPSIGYMRHLKLSEFGWHPSYAIGNSLADPRVGRKTTSPVLQSSREKSNHGWNQYLFGWADGRTSGRGPDYWAMLTRQILFERPTDHFVVYDLSYEVNFNLWDNFFVSTGSPSRKSDFLENPDENPLPNGRIGLYGSGSKVESDITDFHRAASQLWLEGGFNVHSVSKEAWKAVLATTADTGYGSEYAAPFPRLLNPPQGEWLDAGPEDKEATGGFRSLSDGDLDVLAEEIVREVKERAPFFGLSDFVNRRLVDDVHGEKGPIEAALSAAGVNAEFDTGPLKINNENDLPPVRFDNMSDATRLDQTLKPDSVAWGIPGYLTQGDILQVIGSTLRPRSDTFVVRAYGESVDGQGNVRARAWCEAIVQRTPEPVNPDVTGLNPLLEQGESFVDFGRRFRVSNFRWMGPDEV